MKEQPSIFKQNENTSNHAKTSVRKILRTRKNLRTGNLSRVYFLKNAKKARKPNNHDLNHD